jgi:predicted permease
MNRGRPLLPNDDRLGSPQPVAVLGFNLWQSRFGGDPGVIGAPLRINDVPFTIVGIAPPEFAGPEPGSANLFLPVNAASLLRPNDPSTQSLLYAPDYCCSDLVARLAPGATRDQASAELEVLGRSFRQEARLDRTSSDATAWRILATGTEFLARPGRKNQILALVGVLSAGLLLVWLLACANVGNLQIARAASRAREIGVRLSLGASRARVVRQLMTEGLVLSALATVLGVTFAYVLPPLVLRFVADGGTAPFSLSPDGVVLAYAVLLAAVSAVVFGLAPALHATRTEVANALKVQDGSSRSSVRLRTFLLGVQVAISVILLVAAGLLVRGAQQRSGSFDFGFSIDDVSVAAFDVPVTYGAARSDALLADLTQALQRMPDRPFGFGAREPLALSRDLTHIRLPGTADARPEPILYLEATPGYFEVLRIPLVAGRAFASNEGPTAALINESLARAYWPNENAVGKTFLMAVPGGVLPREVVGVVHNAYTDGLSDVQPMLYGPLMHPHGFPKLLLRGTGAAISADIERIVARIDSRVHVVTTPLSAQVADRLQSSRRGAMLAAVLGAFALALAAIGTSGVFAYAVRQRTREIGVRIALGAQPSAVVRLVLGGQSRALFWGAAIGALGAVPASMILRRFLYGLSPLDPISYLGVAAALIVAGLAASYPPARRATRIDPVVALRDE